MRSGVCGPCGRYAVLCGQRWGVSRPKFKHKLPLQPHGQRPGCAVMCGQGYACRQMDVRLRVRWCAVMCGSGGRRRAGQDLSTAGLIRFSRAYSYRCDRIEKSKPVRGIEPPTPRLRSACSTIELHRHWSCGFQNSVPQTASDRLGDLACFSSVVWLRSGLSLSGPLAEPCLSLQTAYEITHVC